MPNIHRGTLPMGRFVIEERVSWQDYIQIRFASVPAGPPRRLGYISIYNDFGGGMPASLFYSMGFSWYTENVILPVPANIRFGGFATIISNLREPSTYVDVVWGP